MKDLKEIIQYIWQHLKLHKKKIYFFVVVSVLDSLFEMGNTFLVGGLIDNALAEKTEEAIFKSALCFVFINILSFVVCYFAKVNGQKTMEISVNECQKQLLRHIGNSSIKHTEEMGAAAFMQRLYSDVYMLVIFVINIVAELMKNVVVFVVALVAVFYLDVICGVVVLLELPLIVLLYKIFEKKLLTREQEAAALSEVSYGKLHEAVSSTGHSKKNQIGWLLEDRFQRAAKRAIDSVVKEVRIGYVYGIVKNNMDVFLRVFLFFYGGFSVVNGNMTVGEFTILYSYITLVISSCGFFLELGKSVQKNKAHYLRIKEISDMPEETNGTDYPSTIQEISFANVNFSYNGKDSILQGFNQTLKRGNLYAITGENGAGKSTMLSLLIGMYIDDYTGEITYNGKNIKELDMRRIRREKIGVCEQEPFLLNDTIRFNVTYSSDICDDTRIMELAMKLNFDAFLSRTDDGIDTVVGQNGSALSGGQKQKTALLKAFYKNAEILILDEPTSAMDETGKEKLKKYLQEIKEDKIILMVTHDTTLMDCVDEVIRM